MSQFVDIVACFIGKDIRFQPLFPLFSCILVVDWADEMFGRMVMIVIIKIRMRIVNGIFII